MKKCLQNMIVKNKKIILRVDYNVPILNGKILDDSKIKLTLDTIYYLLSENCRIILLSHLGKVRNNNDKKKTTKKTSCSIKYSRKASGKRGRKKIRIRLRSRIKRHGIWHYSFYTKVYRLK